jgi:hypothetical protein
MFGYLRISQDRLKYLFGANSQMLLNFRPDQLFVFSDKISELGRIA